MSGADWSDCRDCPGSGNRWHEKSIPSLRKRSSHSDIKNKEERTYIESPAETPCIMLAHGLYYKDVLARATDHQNVRLDFLYTLHLTTSPWDQLSFHFYSQCMLFISSVYRKSCLTYYLSQRLQRINKMCEYTKNYYIYASCQDPGAHFFKCSVDGRKDKRCPNGPHERYIVQPGHCPLC